MNRGFGRGRVIVVNLNSNFEDWIRYKNEFDY